MSPDQAWSDILYPIPLPVFNRCYKVNTYFWEWQKELSFISRRNFLFLCAFLCQHLQRLLCVDNISPLRFFLLFMHSQMSMNKFNKKAILSIHTADICRHIVVRWRKTLVFDITYKALIISVINRFYVYKNKNQFQEPPVLESNSYVSCRWNRPFYHKEPPFFRGKSMEWSLFLLYALPEEVILCRADLANRRFWFSILLKIAMMIFIYIRLLLIIFL